MVMAVWVVHLGPLRLFGTSLIVERWLDWREAHWRDMRPRNMLYHPIMLWESRSDWYRSGMPVVSNGVRSSHVVNPPIRMEVKTGSVLREIQRLRTFLKNSARHLSLDV